MKAVAKYLVLATLWVVARTSPIKPIFFPLCLVADFIFHDNLCVEQVIPYLKTAGAEFCTLYIHYTPPTSTSFVTSTESFKATHSVTVTTDIATKVITYVVATVVVTTDVATALVTADVSTIVVTDTSTFVDAVKRGAPAWTTPPWCIGLAPSIISSACSKIATGTVKTTKCVEVVVTGTILKTKTISATTTTSKDLTTTTTKDVTITNTLDLTITTTMDATITTTITTDLPPVSSSSGCPVNPVGIAPLPLASPTTIFTTDVQFDPEDNGGITYWPVALPWQVQLFTYAFSTLTVSMEGWISAPLVFGGSTFSLSVPFGSRCFIGAYYASTVVNPGQGLFYQISGAAGSRQAVFDFDTTSYATYPYVTPLRFTATFYEAAPQLIDFFYYIIPDGGSYGEVGVENFNTTTNTDYYLQYEYQTPGTVAPGFSLRFDTCRDVMTPGTFVVPGVF